MTFQVLYDEFVTSMTDKMNTVSGTMSGTLTAPLTAAMTLYIILYGWAILRGSIQEPVLDFVFRSVKLLVIWSLVANAGDYSAWAGDTIVNGIPEFINDITGSPGSTLPSDPIMAMANTLALDIQQAYGSGIEGRLYGYLMSLVVVGGAIVFSAIAFVVSLLVAFGLLLMASVGPLFIAFSLFDFTRGWFFSWLGQVLNFGLLKLLVTVMMILMTAFLGDVYTHTDISGGLVALSAFLVALACATIFFFLLPSIASALSAGAGASTGAAQRYVERRLLGTSSAGGSPATRSGSASRTS